MKFILIIFLTAISFSAMSKRITSSIHSVEVSNNVKEPHLIMLNSGEVIFLSGNKKNWISAFEESLSQGEVLEIEVDKKNHFLGVNTIKSQVVDDDHVENWGQLSYEPTEIPYLSDAKSIFYRMRRDYQYYSQCYNRAHIWAYEEFKNSGLKSKKYFMFFTRSYIRRYNYKWWFHVAPAVSVKGMEDRILDRRFTRSHLSINNWTNKFIYSRRKCPIVQSYSDYRDNQLTEDCYLIPVSMYFWQPRDIQNRDRTGYEKTSFINSEVNHAYWEAF